MEPVTAQEMLRYNAWANAQVLEAVGRLDGDEFTRNLPSWCGANADGFPGLLGRGRRGAPANGGMKAANREAWVMGPDESATAASASPTDGSLPDGA